MTLHASNLWIVNVFLSLALISCESDLKVSTNQVATGEQPEKVGEVGDSQQPGNEGNAPAKLVNGDCVDPDLDEISSSVNLTLCNGELASGRLNITTCTQDGQVGCLTTEELRPVVVAQINSADIRSSVTIAGIAGTGMLEAHADCDANGQESCVTTSTYKSADITNLAPSNIRSGVTIAGVTGNVAAESHAACAADGDIGCVVVAPAFKAVDMSLLNAANIRSGVTIAGETGTYPSSITPLQTATVMTDLTSLAANTAAGNYEFFDSAGNRYQGSISDAATITPDTSDKTFNTSLYRQFTVKGDSNLNANNIKSGVDLFGISGSLEPAPEECDDNGDVGCVTTAVFKSADLANLSAENIKNGTVIAGVTGAYPSALHPLPDADGTDDLPVFASVTGGSTYEWFNSAGVRFTGSIEADASITPGAAAQTLNQGLYRSVTVNGDADLDANNIKLGANIFGIAGSVNAAPADCNGNALIGCVTTAVYKSANINNLLAENIKAGAVIAGVTGAYPSAAHPLTGADGDIADLPDFAATTGGSEYEWFNSQGDRLTGSIQGNETVSPGISAQTFNAGLYRSVIVNGDANLIAENIKDDVSIFGVAGNVVPSAPACSSDGQENCVTSASYKAADMSNVIPSNIKDDVIIAGVEGTLSGSPVNCSSNSEVGCVTTNTYKAANITDLLSANIKNGVTIAGVTGTYPSLATPLVGASGTNDLTSLAAATPAGSYEFWDSTGTRHTGNISNASGGTIVPGASAQTFNTSLYRQFTVSGDADLAEENIAAGVQIFSVTGIAALAPANCSANAQVGCVTTATYQAANLSNLVSGNIKNGVNIAGVAGTYPSVATPLVGATGTADLTSLAASTAAGAYEFWDSLGTRYSGSISDASGGTITPGVGAQTFSSSLYRQFTVSGDADLTAANIVSGAQIFGVTGTTAPTPANCSSDGQTNCVSNATYKAANTSAYAGGDIKAGKTIAGVVGTLADCSADAGVGCVTTAYYKAADMSLVSEGNIKSGVTIGGILGSFPSASYPLAGADATADLDATSFSSKIRSASNFEYWDASGARHVNAGDADILATNIKTGVNIFSIAGSVTAETHSDCAADGVEGCVTTASYKSANMAQVNAANVRKGVTIAGVAGDYPSATNRLVDNTGTADLESSTFDAKLKSATAFEYWDSAGTRYSAAGDADITAANIKLGKSIFGTVGTYSGPPNPPTGLNSNVYSTTRIDLSWNAGSFAGYLLVRRTGSAVSWTPTDGSSYSAGSLDGSHTAAYVGASTSYQNTGLSSGNVYHYALFGYDAEYNYSQAVTTSAEIGYIYYRLVMTSVNNGSWLMVSNIDFYIDGAWAADTFSSSNSGTIGGYSATVSAEVNSSFANEAIHDSLSSGSYAWGTPSGHFSSSSPYNGSLWFKVYFSAGSPVLIKGMRIYGCHADCGTTANAPDRWYLEGSNNNSTWFTIPGSERTDSNYNTFRTTYSYTW